MTDHTKQLNQDHGESNHPASPEPTKEKPPRQHGIRIRYEGRQAGDPADKTAPAAESHVPRVSGTRWKRTKGCVMNNPVTGKPVTGVRICSDSGGRVAEVYYASPADLAAMIAAPRLLAAVREITEFIGSLLNQSPDEVEDLLTNEGEEVEDRALTVIAEAVPPMAHPLPAKLARTVQGKREETMATTKKTNCEACGGRGWLLSLNTDRDVYEIQRCDTCLRFETDRDAGETAGAVIEDALSIRSTVIAHGRRGA